MMDGKGSKTATPPHNFLEASEKFSKFLAENSQRLDAFNKPHPPHFDAMCQRMAERDFWTLREGLNMLRGCRPEAYSDDHGIGALWELARNCIGPGGSLQVIDPELKAWREASKVDKHKVRPNDLLLWAEKKKIAIPRELTAALSGDDAANGKTAAATRARKDQQQQRFEAVRSMLDEIDRRARERNLNWDRTCIPVTKADFNKEFYRRTRIEVSAATLAHDVHERGGRFNKGTRDRKGNALERLFTDRM